VEQVGEGRASFLARGGNMDGGDDDGGDDDAEEEMWGAYGEDVCGVDDGHDGGGVRQLSRHSVL